MSASPGLSIFVVAGEASADVHAAALIRELKAAHPGLHFFGVGSRECAGAGMEIAFDAAGLSVVGVSDWLDKASEVVSVYRRLSRLIRTRRPDAAILLDLPDFNLRMARKLHKQGVPILYYISPQVWAWRTYRVHALRKYVERMLVVFPFEKPFYEKHDVPVEFVGHPLLDAIEPRDHFRSREERLAAPRIALLPGSRKSELKFHAPILRETVAKLRQKYPHAEFRVPIASTLPPALVESELRDPSIKLESTRAREILAWADAALVASGTATLETALVGTPFCLYYKLSRSSAFYYQRIRRYKGFLGMPNLLQGKEVVRELFQQKATSENLALECLRLLEDDGYRDSIVQGLRRCRQLLGSPGASRRAAEQVLAVLSQRVTPSGAFLEPAPAV